MCPQASGEMEKNNLLRALMISMYNATVVECSIFSYGFP
jgi:hypothetical protein